MVPSSYLWILKKHRHGKDLWLDEAKQNNPGTDSAPGIYMNVWWSEIEYGGF